MGLAEDMKDVPCIVFAFTAPGGGANSVIPACQNLMLAAHALGIGSLPTTLHAKVMDRFYALFDIPKEMTFHFCIPLGYPAVKYGPSRRRPTADVTSLNRWGGPVPWR
jgi:nitroreductase